MFDSVTSRGHQPQSFCGSVVLWTFSYSFFGNNILSFLTWPSIFFMSLATCKGSLKQCLGSLISLKHSCLVITMKHFLALVCDTTLKRKRDSCCDLQVLLCFREVLQRKTVHTSQGLETGGWAMLATGKGGLCAVLVILQDFSVIEVFQVQIKHPFFLKMWTVLHSLVARSQAWFRSK